MAQGTPEQAGRTVFEAVTEKFARHAALTPDRVAVECEGARRSYAELAARVETFAAFLIDELPRGATPLIGLCLDRNLDLPAWLLAVLRVGGAYLPLDPSSPPARLAQVLDDAMPALIVASFGLALALPPTAIPILIADRGAAPDEAPLAYAPRHPIRQDMLAYLIYTSGSTGRPKGVEIEHGSLSALLETMAYLPGLAAGAKILGLTRISFDLSVPDMFLPFTVGGTLALVGLDVAADPALLANAIDHHRPDLIQATPSTWRALVEAGWPGDPALTLLAGGEAMTRDLADRLLPRCGALWNVYGPTEATVWATAARVSSGNGPVPIGRPLGGVEVEVVDDTLRPVPPGVVGEIAIGGSGVARGYRDRPALTADRFVRMADGRRVYRTGDLGRVGEDGALLCLGRSDDQVKLRGFRIELGDVEAALAAHPEVAWCAVRLCDDPAAEPILVGYVVPRQGLTPGAGAIKAALARTLPPYMIPDRFVMLPVMPLTPNGKVDRAALPSPFAMAEVAPPAIDAGVTTRLAAIWCELLGVARADPADDFFDLGGYSLMTVRLTRRIETEFGVRLALGDLMRWSTLDAMAGRIVGGDDRGGDVATMSLNADGDRPPLYWLDVGPLMRTVLRALPTDQPALTLDLTEAEEVSLAVGDLTIEAVARKLCDRLLALQPSGAFSLGGWCRWGIVAFELARRLREAGRGPELVVILDANYPRHSVASVSRDRMAALIRRPPAAEPISLSQRVERATWRYRPAAYQGDVLLIRPSGNPDDGRWRQLLGGRLTIAEASGNHESMVRAPHATGLARLMVAHLPTTTVSLRLEKER